jgi:DNA-binding PadR family transcriptional regulator
MGTHYDNNDINSQPTRRHHERPDFGQRFGQARGRGRGFGPGGMGPGFGAAFGGFGGPGGAFNGLGGPGFGPGRGGRGRARKGDVRLAILSLLGDAPANGYGLMKSIGERTEGAWRPSPGSVYPTLQQLVDEGLITVSGEGRQSLYQLTSEGIVYVSEHGDEIAKAWGDATDTSDGRHDEFIGSAMKLAGVLKQFAFDATPEQRQAGKEKVDELRRSLYSILAD